MHTAVRLMTPGDTANINLLHGRRGAYVVRVESCLSGRGLGAGGPFPSRSGPLCNRLSFCGSGWARPPRGSALHPNCISCRLSCEPLRSRISTWETLCIILSLCCGCPVRPSAPVGADFVIAMLLYSLGTIRRFAIFWDLVFTEFVGKMALFGA